MKMRFYEEQVIGFLREADVGVMAKDYAAFMVSVRYRNACGGYNSEFEM